MRRHNIDKCRIVVECKNGKYSVWVESYDGTKRCISADHRPGFDSPIVALSWAVERLNVVNQDVRVGLSSYAVASDESLPSPVHASEAVDNTGGAPRSGIIERLDTIIMLLESIDYNSGRQSL